MGLFWLKYVLSRISYFLSTVNAGFLLLNLTSQKIIIFSDPLNNLVGMICMEFGGNVLRIAGFATFCLGSWFYLADPVSCNR